MASYADAAKQHTTFRASDDLCGVKLILTLESDVLDKAKADSGHNIILQSFDTIHQC